MQNELQKEVLNILSLNEEIHGEQIKKDELSILIYIHVCQGIITC